MKYNPNIHNRRSIRLKGYDYSQAGAYFVTICTQNREYMFGDVVDEEMVLNDAGYVAKQCWNDIPSHFPHVELDMFIIMPDHVHGILLLDDSVVGTKNFLSLQRNPGNRPHGTSKTIGSIIRGFKICMYYGILPYTYFSRYVLLWLYS